MVIAVAAFYIILSLKEQDVIRFLGEIESDAVQRLLTNLMPTVIFLCIIILLLSVFVKFVFYFRHLTKNSIFFLLIQTRL